jgi:PAS domain S-box-containing protein
MPKNIKKMFIGFWDILKLPADDCGLFPVSSRIAIYGLILTVILYFTAARFDATELIVIVTFITIITFVESIWKKVGAGKTLIWHFASLLVLIFFLGLLLDQSVKVRESWYRTHVLEVRIEKMVDEAPAPIIISDGLGRIKHINAQGTKLLGWSNDVINGESLSILMNPESFIIHEKSFDKEVSILQQGNVKWEHLNNKILSIKKSDNSFIRVRIYVLGVRYSSDSESGTYLPGADVEFYAIIEPIYSLVDLTKILSGGNVNQKFRENSVISP